MAFIKTNRAEDYEVVEPEEVESELDSEDSSDEENSKESDSEKPE